MTTNPWAHMLEEKRKRLERSVNAPALQRRYPDLAHIFNLDNTIRFTSFEAFRTTLEDLYPQDQQKQMIVESLWLHFNQTQSLGQATIASTRCDLNARFFWSSLITLIGVSSIPSSIESDFVAPLR